MDAVHDFWSKYRPQTDQSLTRQMIVDIARVIYGIPETQPKLSRSRLEPPEEILADWIWEHNLHEIQRIYFSKFGKHQIREFMRHVGDAISYKAPWGLSAFWLFLRDIAEAEDTLLVSTEIGKDLALLPAYAKFGVRTPAAVILSALGITPPSLTRRLGEFWEREFPKFRRDFGEIMRWFEEPDFQTLSREAQLADWQIQRLMRSVERGSGGTQLYRRDWTVECDVHGWQYYDGPRVLKTLKIGQELTLEIEPDSLSDEKAILVQTPNGQKLGYIPWKHKRKFTQRLVKGDLFQVRIRQINPFLPSSRCLRIEV